MGIEYLVKFLQDKYPNCIEYVHEEEGKMQKRFAGKRVAIDANLYLNKYMKTATERELEEHSFTVEMLRKHEYLAETVGLRVLWVFDGKSRKQKANTSKKRAQHHEQQVNQAEQIQSNMEEIGEKFGWTADQLPTAANNTAAKKRRAGQDQQQQQQSKLVLPSTEQLREMMQATTVISELATQSARKMARVSSEMVEQCIGLLLENGAAVVVARHDAEAGCAQLCQSGLVDFVLTTDMDALVFGACAILREISHQKPKQWVQLDRILQETGLTQQQFVDFCILCPNDFSTHLKGVGAAAAFGIVRKHGSIERYMQSSEARKKFSQQQLQDYTWREAADVFAHKDVSSFSGAMMSNMFWKRFMQRWRLPPFGGSVQE